MNIPSARINLINYRAVAQLVKGVEGELNEHTGIAGLLTNPNLIRGKADETESDDELLTK